MDGQIQYTKAHKACRQTDTITTVLASQPHLSPGQVNRKLFPKAFILKRLWLRFFIRRDLYRGRGPQTQDDLDRAADSGHWGEAGRPSDLFLKIFSDVLITLERDPLASMVSPPLIGSSGVMPLSIISVIPDIMRHYAHVIVEAEKEVFLATNYWQPSNSVTTISDALRQLSKRVGERGGEKVIVKLMYDRGTFKQAIHNHCPVPPEGWKTVDLPSEDEIPNLDMEVINFHRPLLGTFHAKFLIVDRKVALLNSNNIQDRPNLEMMIHLEGPIVNSFYDMALISWHNKLSPPLPLLNSPTPKTAKYTFQEENRYLGSIDLVKAAKSARALLNFHQKGGVGHGDGSDGSGLEGAGGPQRSSFADVVQKLMQQMKDGVQMNGDPNANPNPNPNANPNPNPNASVNVNEGDKVEEIVTEKENAPQGSDSDREANGSMVAHANGSATTGPDQEKERGNKSGWSTVAEKVLQKEGTPSVGEDNGSVGSGHTNGNGESTALTPPQPVPLQISHKHTPSSLSANSAAGSTHSHRLRSLSATLNAGALSEAFATVLDTDSLDEFNPHILHKAHKPVPIAMVCRKPHGMPGHQDIRTGQDAAWLAAMRYAERKVFIQTPTFNAAPIVQAVIETCKRGVEVTLFLDLGFNDKGESIPFQGGTNEQVTVRLYKALNKAGKAENLHVYWYTGKDQLRPLNAVKKQRNCHVKFMAVDDQIAIQGNGNQDTQSWFHSQEINVMVDSKQIVADWMATLYKNQNTHLYGKVDKDGIWRDENGKPMPPEKPK